MTSCYSLRPNNGKYYVGKTNSIEKRMIEHYGNTQQILKIFQYDYFISRYFSVVNRTELVT